jgi:hypothetical protein
VKPRARRHHGDRTAGSLVALVYHQQGPMDLPLNDICMHVYMYIDGGSTSGGREGGVRVGQRRAG